MPCKVAHSPTVSAVFFVSLVWNDNLFSSIGIAFDSTAALYSNTTSFHPQTCFHLNLSFILFLFSHQTFYKKTSHFRQRRHLPRFPTSCHDSLNSSCSFRYSERKLTITTPRISCSHYVCPLYLLCWLIARCTTTTTTLFQKTQQTKITGFSGMGSLN